jgi:hypothetical protein
MMTLNVFNTINKIIVKPTSRITSILGRLEIAMKRPDISTELQSKLV